MLTLRAAANLLAQADSLAALRPLAHTLGFPDPPIRVNADARRELTLADLVTDAEVARGPGTLRLLTATLAPPTTNIADARDLTRRLCSVLLRQAPTRLWCVIALDHTRRTVCIATVSPHSNGPRIAALRVDRERVVDSDAETLRALATIPDQHDGLRHARFIDILKRDALSSRFYRALDNTVRLLATTATGSASASERHELALLCTSRCLFLSFLEAKGWLDGDHNFLLRHATTRLELGGRIHERLLRPLFFGTLNTPRTHRAPAAHAFGAVPFLNGGLFSPTPLERARHAIRFNDDALVALIGDLLDRYRFTAREDSTAWSEAAVDPEMLGRSFECLMATDERRRSGSFYTPPALVEHVVRDALEAALPALPPDALRTEHSRLNLSPSRTQQLRNEIVALRVLDPACGSGAFLVHTMERLAVLLLRCGDARPVHLLRQEILSRTVFGVDRNPMAVWLCELRLWLSVVIECPETQAVNVPPLPNLDHHIRVGDALAGGDFQFAPPSARVLGALRERYTRATGRRKQSLATALDREERTRAVAETKRRIAATAHERRGLVQGIRTRDLFGERARRTAADARRLAALRANQRELAAQQHRLELGAALPFRFTSCFADVAAAGGFSLVVGNPPWVRPHALPLAERQRLRLEFRTIRNAAWSAGAKRAGAATGFAAQADLAVAFVERAERLIAPHGTLALLVPAKLWRALAGGGVRRLLTGETRVRTVRDWSDAPALFDAAVYPSLIVAQRLGEPEASQPGEPTAGSKGSALSTHRVHVAVARRNNTVECFDMPARQLPLDGDPAGPWILLPPPVRAAFELLRQAGIPLGDSHFGRPTLGVKCGCNAAFLMHATELDDDGARVTADGRTAVVERLMLRPVLRGQDILAHHGHEQRVTTGERDHRILWTHGPDGAPLRALPPGAARWLGQWRRRLEARRDSRPRTPWWSLFRTDAARHETPRVVWADIGKRLRTTVLAAGDRTVPLNSCYVLRTASDTDAWALDAFLSSPIAGAWLDTLAEPARGGFRRFLGWTVASLPVPAQWSSARQELATLGEKQAKGHAVDPSELTDVVARAYALTLPNVQPLLDWCTP